MSGQLSYAIHSREENFNQVYQVIAEVVEALGLTGAEKYRFAVCVSEAFTNAFYHGNHGDPGKTIQLRFRWDERGLEFAIEDEGQGRLDDVDLQLDLKDVNPEKTGGRGVAIMRGYADKIAVEEKAGGGLRFTLSWRLRPEAQSVEGS